MRGGVLVVVLHPLFGKVREFLNKLDNQLPREHIYERNVRCNQIMRRIIHHPMKQKPGKK